MIVKVRYKINFGVEMFYPCDEWTTKLLDVFRPPSIRGKSFSRRQIDGLKSLGFEIEAASDKVEI